MKKYLEKVQFSIKGSECSNYFTFSADSRINCLAESLHIAGTVNTQRTDSTVMRFPAFRLLTFFIKCSFRKFIAALKTSSPDIDFPLEAFSIKRLLTLFVH